jgi:uncharacterized membrane protein YfcA
VNIQWAALGALAFVPSLIGALSGIGGGIIIKPALDAVYPGGPGEANFLSGCTVLAMALVSLIQRRLGGSRLEDRRGIALAAGAGAGGLAGRLIFSLALSGGGEGRALRMIQSALIIILTLAVWTSMNRRGRGEGGSRNTESRLVSVALGFALGLLSSFLGIGGGPMNILVLSSFLGMDTRTAGHYSLLTVFISQLASLGQSLCTGTVPGLPVPALAVMAAGGVLGGLAGSRLLRKLDDRRVELIFRGVLALVILLSGYNLLRFAPGV